MTTVKTEKEGKVETLEVTREDVIAAPIGIVFETVLEQLGPMNATGEDQPMPMVLEAWPGGRWFRDLGEGRGHWWGTVQAIKPPTLIELCGPLFMSMPVTSNIQFRLEETDGGTRLRFAHRAAGWLLPEYRMVGQGWEYDLRLIRQRAERKR
jgi:uncharacterized protein YndB with AHSA1/START domain